MSEQAVFAVILAILIAALAAATVQSGRLLRQITPAHNLLLSLPDNAVRLVLIAFCVALGVLLGPGVDALGWSMTGFVRASLLGALVGLLLAPLFLWFSAWAVRRWGNGVYDNRLLRAIVPVDCGEWVWVALALFPAALLEELLFRSLPLAGFAHVISPWVLMWPLALFFGLLHWPQGPLGVVGTSFMAVALSAIFLWSGSLWTAVFAHWVLNLVEVTLAWRQGLRPLRADSPSV